MPLDEAMALTNRLLTSADALAAVTARLRLVDLGDGGDPALRAHLERVADALDARQILDALDERERAIVVAFARSYLNQALDLVEDPLRRSGWTYTDPVLLQAQGAASAAVASLFAAAGLGRPGIRILDVGTGVAGLAIAFCRTFPGSTVVGIDPWEPALAIARRNVDEAELGDRITLVAATVEQFDDEERFDLAWLPSFFIPEGILDDAIERIHDLLAPDGTIVVGTLQREEGSLESAVDDLRNLRSGGSVTTASDATARLNRAGFGDVGTPDLGADVPLRLVVGRRA